MKLAILFSGSTFKQHLNELELFYRMLLMRDYKKENIYVLNYNGLVDYTAFNRSVDLEPRFPGLLFFEAGEYQLTVNYPGRPEYLSNVILDINSKLGKEDTLTLFTTGHGMIDDRTGETVIDGWTEDGPAEYITLDALVSNLNMLKEFKALNVIMLQCFSGGFGEKIVSNITSARNVSFIAATDGVNNSRMGKLFSPFIVSFTYGFLNCWDKSLKYLYSHIRSQSYFTKPVLIESHDRIGCI